MSQLSTNTLLVQGIKDIQDRKLCNFFSRTLTMANIFKELFTPTLNGIVVSVRHVSSTPVVWLAGLNVDSRRTQIDKAIRNKKNQRSWRFFRSG